MKILFLQESLDEFSGAVEYYNTERPGLGFEFAAEVRNALNRIKKYPDSWPAVTDNIRKCIINRFPFAALYHREDDRIVIVALMHMKRLPGYWKKRTE